MNTMSHPRIHNRDGNMLIIAMITLTTLLGCLGVALSFTSNTARQSGRSRQMSAAETVGEGGMEIMYAKWRAAGRAALQSSQGLPTTATIGTFTGAANAPSPTGNPAYPDFAGFTFAGYSLLTVDQFGSHTDQSGTPYVNPPGVIMPLAGRPGWLARTYNYIGKSTVTAPTSGSSLNVTVGRLLQKADAPIFQAAIFYEMDLEIHPGADMNVTGLVHTNSNLYACAGPPVDSHNLTLSSNVSYVGTYAEGFAPGDARTPFNTPVYSNGKSSQLNQVDRLEPIGTEPATVFNTVDANPNNDGFRELIERPVSGQTDPPEIASLRFYNQAGLKILVDTSLATANANRISIYNGNNVLLTTTSGDAKVTTLVTAIKAAISTAAGTGETITDKREANSVLLTSLDLSKLSTIITSFSALAPPTSGNAASQSVNTYNKVIYICDVSGNNNGGTSMVNNSATTQAEKAIRLKNGAILPGDLTIASENPVYIQGDYNTGGPTTSVASNATTSSSPLSAFSTPTAPGYSRKSCAVLGDAVSILSNSWVDANSSSSAGGRIAINTTVNTAIMSGIVPTNYNSNGRYSGGAENFPRLLEDWGSGVKNLAYYGSMVSLFISKQGNGAWGNSDVYAFPSRRLFFDTNFIQNPPPGTLQSTTYSRGRWARF